MTTKHFSALVLIAALLCAGCSKEGSSTSTMGAGTTGTAAPAVAASKLHGSWDAVMPNGTTAVATFNADGSYKFEAPNPAAPAMIIRMMGEYREDGDTLFLKWTDAEFENTPAEVKAQEPQMLEQLKKTLDVGKEVQTKVEWDGDDAFKTTSPEGKIGTFKRK